MLLPIEVAADRLRRKDIESFRTLVLACRQWDAVPKHVAIDALECGILVCPHEGKVCSRKQRDELAAMKVDECAPVRSTHDACCKMYFFLHRQDPRMWKALNDLEAVCIGGVSTIDDPTSSRLLFEFGLISSDGTPNTYTRDYFIPPIEYEDSLILNQMPSYNHQVI